MYRLILDTFENKYTDINKLDLLLKQRQEL